MDANTVALIVVGVVTGLVGFVAACAISIAGWSLIQTIEQGKQIATLQQQGTDQTRALEQLHVDFSAAREEFKDGVAGIRNMVQDVLMKRRSGDQS
jgi:phage-related minor tail protein